MLQENKIQTIFDEHFPQQILPSPVASRIKQQVHQQLQASRQTSPVINPVNNPVTNPVRQRQKIDLQLALSQWWESLQFQPMPSFALAGAAVVFVFLTYFLVQPNLLNGLYLVQPTGDIGSTTVITPYEDSAIREPEVAFIIPTVDDMQLSTNPSTLQAVAIAATATPMAIMPTPLPEISSAQIILKPTSTAEPTAYPPAMDHPPTVLESTPTQPAIVVAMENILPTPIPQMPTPNHNLSQAEIIIRPTLDIIFTPIPQPIVPTPTFIPTATFVPTVPPTNLPDYVIGASNSLGIIGSGPSMPPGLAANGATATAQSYDALSILNQVPTLLPPSQIVASPLSPILPTATPYLPTPVPAAPASAMSILPPHTPTDVPIKIAEGMPTEIIPSPTLLPTHTSIPTETATDIVADIEIMVETEIEIETATPTPRPPEPTDTPRSQSNNSNSNSNSNNKDNRDENRGDHADPQPTATPVPPQVVHVPVEPPTAPPPVPTDPPATAILAPAPIPPTVPPVQPPTQSPPTQSPPTSTPKPVHTATSAPTKRPPTATPARLEINPIAGVPEPTARPTAIVQLPAPTSEPVRESGQGAEPVTGKDSNPVKPVFTPTSPPDRTKPTPMRVEINPVQDSPKAVPTLTPRPTSKPIVLDSEAVSDTLLGHDEEAELESATE